MASSVFPLCKDWYPSMFSTNSSGLFFGSLEFFSSSYFRSIASVPFSFATNSSCRAVDRSSGMYFHPYSWATLRRTSTATKIPLSELAIIAALVLYPRSSPARLETLHRLRYAQILPAVLSPLQSRFQNRSEERRVGKECRYRWLGNHEKEKSKD